MSVCLLAIGDGRDRYHAHSWASLREMLPDVEHTVEIDDREHRLGFAGAIAEGWRQALRTDATHIFHAELDFTYLEPINLAGMIGVLHARPHLAQVSLKRQPVNAAEVMAGGFVECQPDSYREVDGVTEHAVCFTTNPSVYPAALCHRGWPQVAFSEGVFSASLRDEGWRFAIWGAKFDAPRVQHIGDVRAGAGY